jgi:hypothetical protein
MENGDSNTKDKKDPRSRQNSTQAFHARIFIVILVFSLAIVGFSFIAVHGGDDKKTKKSYAKIYGKLRNQSWTKVVIPSTVITCSKKNSMSMPCREVKKNGAKSR